MSMAEVIPYIFDMPLPAGLDYLCVQSFDGQLSVFECESFAFARFLPNFLIPGVNMYR